MNRTIGLISTNFSLGDFGVLTAERPEAALPFGGRYRLLDFALSNLVNARIQTVGLITPYFYRSIMDHVGAGKEWGLDRKDGGLYILPGTVYGFRETDGPFLFRDFLHNDRFFRQGDGDYVLVTSGAMAANIDFQPMIAQHEMSGDHVTLLYRPTREEDRHDGYFLTVSDGGRVTAVTPGDDGDCRFLDSFIIDRTLMLRLLRDFESLGRMDFMEILRLVLEDVHVGAFRFDGYIAPMKNARDYLRSNMDLQDPDIRHELFGQGRQILTKIHDAPPSLYADGSRVRNSVVASGCVIEGSVENCVIFRSVRIEKGVSLKNCVVMDKCIIRAGAQLENVICDRYVTVSPDTCIKGTAQSPCVLPKGGVI